MKPIGIEKASRRLREASKHIDRLDVMSSGLKVPEFEYEWYLAIQAINSTHEILRTSAWKDPRAKQWFASLDKHIIRKDPLLRFILHARGADHHGLSAGTSPNVTGADYIGYTENAPISFHVENAGKTTSVISGGAIVLSGDVKSFKFEYVLVPVTDDRDGTIYSPPTSHLGFPIESQSPVSVARSAIMYYDGLLKTAYSKFIKG